jgi:hypothetical protein
MIKVKQIISKLLSKKGFFFFGSFFLGELEVSPRRILLGKSGFVYWRGILINFVY